MTPRKTIRQLYQNLLKTYGHQGWWPVSITGDRQTDLLDDRGYHAGSYDIPHQDDQKLEIALGAILTQNTNWNNARAALHSLADCGLFSLKRLLDAKIEQIALAIRSAGYYNQKSQTVKNLVQFLNDCSFEKLERLECRSARDRLMDIRGIGPETADSILLYALKQPSFVIDAYTKRICFGIGIATESVSYESLQQLFESSLERDLAVFQEYHALLVLHGKQYYSRKPHGKGDEILCPSRISGKPS